MLTRKRSILGVFLVVMTIAGIASAKPDYGINCAQCHSLQSGQIQVTGNDTTTGGLKTFVAAPGDTVALSVNVLGGGGKYALQMIGLDSSGQTSAANKLSYTADGTWSRYTTGGLYYTKSGSATGVQSFNVTINAATPGDLYKLTFGIGYKGSGLGYQTEDFYLQVEAAVVPEPDPVISGSVATAGGAAISGVLLTATGGLTATSNASGAYSITVPFGFTGVITPSKADYTFSPASGSYSNLTANQSNARYTGEPVVVAPATFTISGHVMASDGSGVSSAVVSAGNNGGSAVTDAAGYYSITVSEGWSGAVTVTKADYSIEPASNSYTNVTADFANENYLATAVGGGVPIPNPVISAEIHQAIDYNDPAIADDTTYVFYFAVETGSTVNSVDILTPAGSTIHILSDAHTQAAGVETWHIDNLSTHLWAYEAINSDAASLDDFGDGTYTVTVNHGISDQSQTDILFGVANSAEAISQPSQEPVVTAPAQNGQVASPVTVEWEPYTEALATSIRLELTGGNGSIIANDYAVDAAASASLTPAVGIYNGRLSFENGYQSVNTEGIPVTAVKYSEIDFSFEVQADAGGTPGDGGDNGSGTGQEVIVDNADAGASFTGIWKTSGGKNYHGVDSVWSRKAGDTFTFQADLSEDRYVVFMSWTEWPSRMTNVPVEILNNGTSIGTVSINQKLTGGQWNLLGIYDLGGIASVTITSNGPGSTNADAVRFLPLSELSELVIDNGAPGTSSTGSWKTSGGKKPYARNSLWSRGADATYSFKSPLTRKLEVYAWWTLWGSRMTDVPVEIRDGGVLLDTVYVNQKANGSQWNYLGEWTFAENAEVTIVSQGPGSTNADAVKFVSVETESSDNNNTDPGGNTDPGDDSDPGNVDVDVITVEKARYKVENEELRVEVKSSDQPNAVLTVVGYGEMTFDDDKYKLKVKPVADPGDTVTVTSSSGGSITIDVELDD